MQLKPATEKALEKWISTTTWHTNHGSDMDRFYDFVSMYQREHGYEIDEAAMRKQIEDNVGGQFNDDDEHGLRNIIRRRLVLANNILDFLNRSQR